MDIGLTKELGMGTLAGRDIRVSVGGVEKWDTNNESALKGSSMSIVTMWNVISFSEQWSRRRSGSGQTYGIRPFR